MLENLTWAPVGVVRVALGTRHTKLAASEPKWKVLIYDSVGQDIISVLISVKELRELGVTLFVQLHSDRDPIPEVPANSFADGGELGQKLEDLASAALQANCVANIHKVYDQYVNFISLDDDMFILKNQNSDALSYYAINKGDTKDTEMDEIMDKIVDCLFSVFVTLGTVPIIRSPKGNAAEMVAKKLDKKLRENLADARNNLLHSDTQS
ncbi:hypothetical protein Zmor_009124 [Zophobas morio]|uniref:Uncharacterized protein n=1 Tax=Zophobas morio TaxID=2755281 RepID=A0AA38MIG4_9CUCU|nr:hypothetical protein Zmor_009124 [Zophobas morio]